MAAPAASFTQEPKNALALLLTLASTALAQTENSTRLVRTSQPAQIRYDDPDGTKVNWKFYVPYNQQHSNLENPQRGQRAETVIAQPQTSGVQHQQRLIQSHQQPSPSPLSNVVPNQQEYKSYASVPTHIKELILQTYEPQRPYVDPSAFIHQQGLSFEQANSRSDISQSSQYESPIGKYQTIDDTRTASTDFYYGERMAKPQGRINYKEDYDQRQNEQHHHDHHHHHHHQHHSQSQENQNSQQSQQIIGITVPIETMPVQPVPKLVIDKNMPQEIQQLLHYQSQIPYDVIANRITYRPKTLFIPKPIPDDSKGPYYYKSKIYFMKDDNIDEIEDVKSIDDSQRH
ncbi:putative cyclin-dependent serine/threonine-protein kinase DDB_G0272797/DDB_G0274007 [Vespa velutina]|uniref:putative cyclin-dependent serine/threonine-protein kinase DDB_G0272797/DDB_G0274007 n=1 Tax=Vespa velutina TaxID=202808 RepID=UPI001FB3A674|nr:putative cyclin-dependent serine/threonine-protein kinase DDB_G0272797/DDB_G0274007 [Vespa velutina]